MTGPVSGSSTSSSPSAATQLGLAGWQAALAAEHAAVYGYAIVGVHLTDTGQIAVAAATQEAHRDTRDALMLQIAAAGIAPAPPKALYTPLQPVLDAASAQRWAVQLEQACAAGYRYVLTLSAEVAAGTATPTAAALSHTRSQALTGLTAAAVAACSWQALLTPATPTVPFPGT